MVSAAAEDLDEAGVPEPEAAAEILLAELLDVGRSELILRDLTLSVDQKHAYEAWISRRLSREPVQRILGYAYFRNLRLRLSSETLIPRADTESVVDAALECMDLFGARRVLDVGTGSGAIAISIAQERPSCEVYATDISEQALRLAADNASEAGVEVDFRRTDLASGLEDIEPFDLIVSNPPYVETGDIPGLAPEVRDWDPHTALDGGPDGLEFYRRIFVETPPVLKAGGRILLEVGDGRAEEVLDIGRRSGLVPHGGRPDLTGRIRSVLLQSRPG